MDFLVILVHIGPPVIALILPAFARSQKAKWLLRTTAVLCLLIFGLIQFASFDCEQYELAFTSCDRLPDAFGDMMEPVYILYSLSYFTAGPILLFLAATFEVRARRRKY